VFDNHYGSDLLTELFEDKINLPNILVNEIYSYVIHGSKTTNVLQNNNANSNSNKQGASPGSPTTTTVSQAIPV